ncbi:alpha/beta hydrolase [Paenibacillus tepidiphilus]|uniref:alpha/beta hydrolase n=1 Tax=Paenibacillus tepidiphilus TaxID=2608683 RepID=UPI0013A547C9|nr:alpha/beta hydrolase [Paenibacillus tepidiphilus]
MRTDPEQLQTIKRHLRLMHNHEGKTVQQIRGEMLEAAQRLPVQLSGIVAQAAEIGGIGGEWVYLDGNSPGNCRQAVLYYHGGGFTTGSAEIYRDLAGRVSGAGNIPVFIPDYRLAPEHPYPAANEDALAAYRWLLAHGYSAADIVLGGDSVGATLALMTLITLRDQGEELPAGAFLWSPHSDLVHLDGDTYDTLAELDWAGSREGNRKMLQDYLGEGFTGVAPDILSPLRLPLQGLPPLFIQTGGQEVLLSDAQRLAERAQQAGVTVTFEVWEEMWTVFQTMAGMLPEAAEAVDNTGSFIRSVLGR